MVEKDTKPKLQGYAAVFNSKSQNLGGFREIIRHGAFSKTIQEDDIRALFNHNPNYVLGRNKAGTLRLAEDSKGLEIEIIPPDAVWARDLTVSIERGDIDQMSFGFRTIKDKWGVENRENLRELLQVQLLDVSPVTYPAYEATEVQARSLIEGVGLNFADLQRVITRGDHGLPLTKEDRDIAGYWIETLRKFTDEPKDEPPKRRLDDIWRELKELENLK